MSLSTETDGRASDQILQRVQVKSHKTTKFELNLHFRTLRTATGEKTSDLLYRSLITETNKTTSDQNVQVNGH